MRGAPVNAGHELLDGAPVNAGHELLDYTPVKAELVTFLVW